MLIGFGVFFLAIVSCEYSFKSALVEVRRKGVKEFSESVEYPGSLKSFRVQNGDQIVLSVPFGEDVVQATALLHSGDQASEAIVGQKDGKNYKFSHTVNGKGGKYDKSLYSGEYELIVVFGGDATLKKKKQVHAEWSLGVVNVDTLDKPRRILTDPIDTFEPLPEIKHVFALPSSRPPCWVSLAFTGLVLAPWLILLKNWVRLGANIREFPMTDLWTLLFQASIVLILVVLVKAWLEWTLFTTLTYLFFFGVSAILFGKQALHNVAIRRLGAK